MTFSIVARSADGDAWGVAVASKFLAVGAVVPAAQAGVGAIATQSFANLTYRPKGLAMMADGRSAQATLDALTAADADRAERQAGIVDALGRSATFTGERCLDWAGGVNADDVAIQGNILTGPEVVDAMHVAWRGSDPVLPLARRLLSALRAGDGAGGDRRGRQSAAVLVVTEDGGYGGFGDVLVDLRVDDHADPCTELERLLDLHHLYFEQPAAEDLLVIDDALAAEIDAHVHALGHGSLDEWLGVQNYEMRVVDGKIDRVVLGVLRDQAAATDG